MSCHTVSNVDMYMMYAVVTSRAFIPSVPDGSWSLNLAHFPSSVAVSTRSKSDNKAVMFPLPLHMHSIADSQLHVSFSTIFEPKDEGVRL